ncbi:MAG: glycoside hydrolase family 97 N-terminal domain-containing protein, partial [Prolixibacteraceae bacterium]|nr:glycoside hydrolase family 97 N-terminal domain-containing protein [Prolixibacteraceae bacterium]
MKSLVVFIFFILIVFKLFGENFLISSPDSKTSVSINIDDQITYGVSFNQKMILDESYIEFVFAQAPPLGRYMKVENRERGSVNEIWKPVLKRYESIKNQYNFIRITAKEIKFPQREIILEFRVFNDGVAFRTEFPSQFGNREYVLKDELSSFNFPENFMCWAVNYASYTTSQEVEHFQRKLGDITSDMVIGLPVTVKVDDNCYAAITEAALVDYAGMYLKPDLNPETYGMRTALSPRKGQPENGDKVIFRMPHKTPWRVIMIGENPGDLVESEIIQNLNVPCEIDDPSWIKPGISAWDHWWSGEVKMEQPVIYEYIDLASSMGWPYMLIDWQWYGPFNQPDADIT